jgi:hypothetical protein
MPRRASGTRCAPLYHSAMSARRCPGHRIQGRIEVALLIAKVLPTVCGAAVVVHNVVAGSGSELDGRDTVRNGRLAFSLAGHKREYYSNY